MEEEKEFAGICGCGIAGKEVLEVGCGDGRITRRLVKVAKKVVGIAPDEGKAAKARENCVAEIIVGSGERLPFPDAVFDVVLYTLSFHHLSDQEAGLGEARRVLRHGGKIVIYEPDAEGQVQRLFLLFEGEREALAQTYQTVGRAKALGKLKWAEQRVFSIRWEFNNFAELVGYFAKQYGREKVEGKRKEMKEIAGKGREKIGLEDRVVLLELG